MFRFLLIIAVFVIGFVCGAKYGTLDRVPGLSWLGDKAQVLDQIPLPPAGEETAKTKTKTAGPKSTFPSLYAVQVGSFRSKDQANKLIDELHKEQLNAYIARTDLENDKGWYRVYVGEYVDRDNAEARLALLKPRYTQAFIQKVE
jgi:cell division septation protein DedD